MSDNKLGAREILVLKAQAYHLRPAAMVGQRDLIESVIKETNAASIAHKLIRVRIFGDDCAERIEICDALCETLGAQLV